MADDEKYHLVTQRQLEVFENGMSHMVDRATSDMGAQIAEAEDLMAKIKAGTPLVDIEIHTDGGEWSGLYVDGKLAVYGDTYLAQDRLEIMVGAKEVRGGDWLIDGNTPLRSVEEVNARRSERLGGEEKAAELRAQAQALLDEASTIDGKTIKVGAE